VQSGKKELFVIAEDVDGEALATFVSKPNYVEHLRL